MVEFDCQINRGEPSRVVGVSIIICCHNSASRIGATLDHIKRLQGDELAACEVLVIDNASSDGTGAVAEELWHSCVHPAMEFRLIYEPDLGIGNARYRGIREAQFDYVCFVDDDNWLNPDYLTIAFPFMQSHPHVAACGGRSIAVCESAPPVWFDRYGAFYAVGTQSASRGDITWTDGYLWTAGMMLRRSAIIDLLEAGFRPAITGARGASSLMRSEDVEMCFALRLAGWSLWCLPELCFRHYIPSSRLSWQYLRGLQRGVGASYTLLIPYLLMTDGSSCGNPRALWRHSLMREALVLARHWKTLIKQALSSSEGASSVLSLERQIGLVWGLLRNRNKFVDLFQQLQQAPWISYKGMAKSGSG